MRNCCNVLSVMLINLQQGMAYGFFSHEFVTYILTNPITMKFLNWCNLTARLVLQFAFSKMC